MKALINKKLKAGVIFVLALLVILGMAGGVIFAKSNTKEGVISEGVTINGINVSGMTKEEAQSAVDAYISSMSGAQIDLHINEHIVTVPVSEFGFSCDAKDVAEQAVELGKSGNIVKRYKESKEIEMNGKDLKIAYQFSEDNIRAVLAEKCTVYDVKAKDAGLKKTASGFVVTDGESGYALDVEASLSAVLSFLSNEWDGEQNDVAVVMAETQPRGAGADLEKVKDLLGSATTSYSSSGKSRCGNVERGASLIDGTLLYPGEEFSAYEKVSPISIDNGYFMAASYENGQVVESPGGGICQVSTTLYNAVLKSELQVTQRSNHSMIVTYVDPSKDAAIAGTYKDLKFVNNLEYPIYIEGITEGKKITFNIYGVETRSPSRTVEYVSETVSETPPTTKLSASGANFGSISTTQSAHKGLVAKLWKVVYQDGVEVSRDPVNQSTYQMSPRIVSVGTGNATPEALNELNAAIAANDEGAARAVIAKYGSAGVAQPEDPAVAAGSEGVIPPTEGQPQEGQPAEGQPQQDPAAQEPQQDPAVQEPQQDPAAQEPQQDPAVQEPQQ